MFNAWPFAIKFARQEPRIFVQMQLVSPVSLRGNHANSRDRLTIHNLDDLGVELLVAASARSYSTSPGVLSAEMA